MRTGIETSRNILMELRKVCQHTYLAAPDFEDLTLDEAEQHKRLINGSGKLAFLKLLLPKLKERGHRVLLFSQFKMALDRIQDFLEGEGLKFLRLDGDVQQAQRQKDMDAFNAPGSDVFVFLLTTRAGGVGINLATADTVIIFDPDFNPHQDLQAISRSHRYGQTKKVLVFKLMTKNSCEEKIIQAGKKKMVLDHLVVQSIDTEHEEGDIDSILLHGAAALYEKEVDGVAPSDVVYNSKNVDEMIDRVEKEADEVAARLAEKERLEAEAVARGEKIEASKETKSFGFAKIWEAEQNGLAEVAEEDEELALEQDEEGIMGVMEHVAAERERRMAEASRLRATGQRQARNKVNGLANGTANGSGDLENGDLNGYMSEDTPKKKKDKKKGRKSGKGSGGSDEEFAPLGDESESEGSEPGKVEPEGLLDEQGRPILVGGLASGAPLAPPRGHKKHARPSANGTPTQTPPVNGGEASTSAAIPAAASTQSSKEMKFARKVAERRKLIAANTSLQIRAKGTSPAGGAGPYPARLATAPSVVDPNIDATAAAAARKASLIRKGRQDAQWLYHVLREFGYVRELNHWAKAALDTVPLQKRGEHWTHAARKANAALVTNGQKPYFEQEDVKEAVMELIMSNESWTDPAGQSEKEKVTAMLPYPEGVGKNKWEADDAEGVQDAVDRVMEAQRAEIERVAGGVGAGGGGNVTSSSATGLAVPSRPVAGRSASATSINGQSTSLAVAQQIPLTKPTPSLALASVMAAATATATAPPNSPCPMCNRIDHTFLQCGNKPTLQQLTEFRATIPSSDTSEQEKASHDAFADWLEECERVEREQMRGKQSWEKGRLIREWTVVQVLDFGQEPQKVKKRRLDKVEQEKHDDAWRGYEGAWRRNVWGVDGRKAGGSLADGSPPLPMFYVNQEARDDPEAQARQRALSIRPVRSVYSTEDFPTLLTPANSLCPLPYKYHRADKAEEQCPSDDQDLQDFQEFQELWLTLMQSASHEQVERVLALYRAAGIEVPESIDQVVPDVVQDVSMEGEGTAVASTHSVIGNQDAIPTTATASRTGQSPTPTSKGARATPSVAVIPSHVRASTPQGRGTGGGGHSKRDAIMVDDESDEEASRPAKRMKAESSSQQTGDSIAASASQPPRGESIPIPSSQLTPSKGGAHRGRKRFHGCEICGATRFHVAALCPTVAMGSRAIDEAMQKFKPADPLYGVLSDYRQTALTREAALTSRPSGSNGASSGATEAEDITAISAPPPAGPKLCAFCLSHCGRSIKECAIDSGGRAALKGLLRALGVGKEDTQAVGPKEEARRDELYDVYTAWPR